MQGVSYSDSFEKTLCRCQDDGMVVTVSLNLTQGGGGFGLALCEQGGAYQELLANSRPICRLLIRNLHFNRQVALGELSSFYSAAISQWGTYSSGQEPLSRLLDNIHGDGRHAQRLEVEGGDLPIFRGTPTVEVSQFLSRPTRPGGNFHVLLVQPSQSGPSPNGLPTQEKI